MAFLGVDIGTSGCKAVAFDVSGRQLASAHRAYSVQMPKPGYAELDSRLVLDSCCEVIAEVARKAPVRALCVSCQGEAFTPVDAKGACLGNAMVSSDCRAASLVDEFGSSFGVERLYEITGHTPAALFTLFKLLWLKRHDPKLWDNAVKFLCFEDLLHLRLGVEPAMGWPLAGRTMLFDIKRHVWSKDILDALELDERKLPRTLQSGGVAGVIPDAIASSLGLPSGVKIVCGGHDQTLAALGSGVCEPGEAMYAAGTVECLCPVFTSPTQSAELCRNNLCCYDYSLPGRHTSVAYSLTGSNLLQYLLREFGDGTSYDSLLAQLPAEPTSLLALPYFTPSGTPHFDAITPGAIFGLRLTTSKGEIIKALLEAVALEMKLNLSLLEASGISIARLVATGGGSRNRTLLQMKTDILNKPMARLDIDEAGCFGAAMLAASACENIPTQELLRNCLHRAPELLPDPRRAELYSLKFDQYKQFQSGMRALAGQLLKTEG
jgi:xylulokinase